MNTTIISTPNFSKMGPEGDRRASATARQTSDDDAITPLPELRTQAPSERTISPANRELSPEVASVRQEERSPSRWRGYFAKSGKLRPFRLLKEDSLNFRLRYISDWTVFNQLVLASAIYVFFTNILPGITFASDLYVLTGESWGTIEVVFSTGLCGIIFAL